MKFNYKYNHATGTSKIMVEVRNGEIIGHKATGNNVKDAAVALVLAVMGKSIPPNENQ